MNLRIVALSCASQVLAQSGLAAETTTYSYDALGRLVLTNVSSGPASGEQTALSYDAAGNRTQSTVTASRSRPPAEAIVVAPINGLTLFPTIEPERVGPAVPSTVALSVQATTAPIQEGQSVTFRILKSSQSADPVSVNYATADGAASSHQDYVGVTGVATFKPWETERLVVVASSVDTQSEPAEDFTLVISTPSAGALITTASASAVIAANTYNNPPVAQNDFTSVGVCESASVNVLANDTDAENHLPLALISASTSSTLVTADTSSGQVVVSAGGATGSAEVTYVFSDSMGAISTGTLFVAIAAGSGCQ